jgi:hypothetical protein
MEQYLWIIVNHLQNYWMWWLPQVEFVVNNGASETTICLCSFSAESVNLPMMFLEWPEECQDKQSVEENKMQNRIQQIHIHMEVETR